MWRRYLERRAFQRISYLNFSFGGGWRKVGREGGRVGEGIGGSMRVNIVFFFLFRALLLTCRIITSGREF